MPSTVVRLRNELSAITDTLASLITELPVKHRNQDGFGVIFIGPDHYWGETTSAQANRQLAIKRDYDEWYEVLRSVFRDPTNDVGRRILEAHRDLVRWVESSSNWSITANPANNVESLRRDAGKYHDVLAILEAGGATTEILIPDTNALVSEPDPEQYRAVVASEKFIIMLLPAVLGELDNLKNNHRNPEFREKVRKTITRIKGWRNQGSLREGVTVNRDITVKAIAREPDTKASLSWLDFDNQDDRIIASVLEVQAANPTARVVLVTGDINLCNKADVARIETAELA